MQYDAHSRVKEVATQTLDSVHQIGLLCQLVWVQLIQEKSNTGLSYAHTSTWRGGQALAQLVEALIYRPKGCGFDFRCCHWDFSLT